MKKINPILDFNDVELEAGNSIEVTSFAKSDFYSQGAIGSILEIDYDTDGKPMILVAFRDGEYCTDCSGEWWVTPEDVCLAPDI